MPRRRACALPDEEAEHLVRVLRLGVGAEVEVFDGRGGLWRAEVVEAGKRSASVRAIEPVAAGARDRHAGRAGHQRAQGRQDGRRRARCRDAGRHRHSSRGQRAIARSACRRWRRASAWRGGSGLPCRRPSSVDERWCQWWRRRGRFAAYLAEPVAGARLICVELHAAVEPLRRAPLYGAPYMPVQAIAKPASAHVIVGPEGGWSAAELAAALAAGAVPDVARRPNLARRRGAARGIDGLVNDVE